MLEKSRHVTMLILCFLISGCLVPEKFAASVTINPDATYLYRYKGTAVHAMLAAAQQQGKLGEKEEETLHKEAATEKSKGAANGIRKFEYLGKARYELLTEQTLKFGQRPDTVPLVTVIQGKDGVVTVASNEISKNDLDKLSQLKIQIDGELGVILPANAEVISHNATSTPGWFSRTYTWKIGQINQRPIITFKMPASK